MAPPRSLPTPRPLSPDPADPSEPLDDLQDGRSGRARASARSAEHPVRTPRRPGRHASKRDIELVRAQLAEQVRRERPDLDPSERVKLVEDRLEYLTSDFHPKVGREYAKLEQTSWCPDRRLIRDHVEVRAIRQLPEVRELEAILTPLDAGRPSTRRMPLATFERMAMGDCRPEIRAAVKEFTGSNAELDWAYVDTTDVAVVAEHLRDESSVRRTMKAMLERHDPNIAIELAMRLVNQLARQHPNPFKYLVIDATPIEGHLLQTGDVDKHGANRHRKLMNRGTGAEFGYHGGRDRKAKRWRGWKLLTLGSITLGVGMIELLIPADEPEYPYVLAVLEQFFSLADPELLPKDEIYLVGDSEYDRSTRLAFDLQSRMNVVPVFDLRETVGKGWEWAATDGVPHCAKHGAMKRIQGEKFVAESVPLAYQEDFEAAKKDYDAHVRWECVECKQAGVTIRANTWVRKNARIYTNLPRCGDDWRFALRLALMAKRNCIEGLFSQLKLRGVGGRNHFKPKWVSEVVHMQWLCYTANLAMVARRVAHETGVYADCVAEANSLRLTKQPLTVPAHAKTPQKEGA